MRNLDPTDDLVRGVVSRARTSEGLRLSRLPAAAEGRDPDPQLVLTASMAAGMRLRVDSDTRALELDVEAAGLRYVGGERRRVAFDLFVDDRLFERRVVSEGPTLLVDFGSSPPGVIQEAGPTTRLRFEGLPPGLKRLELWLPQNAAITLKALRIDAEATASPPSPGRRSWLHYGSSISHGKEADGPSDCWPAIVARALDLDLTSLGYSGNCLLEGFVAQALARSDADILTLEIGVNVVSSDAMRERAFIPAIHTFLDILRDARPDVPILVISPLYAGVLENHPGPARRGARGIEAVSRPAGLAEGALTGASTRHVLEGLVERRRAGGDRRLHYRDGRALLGEADAGLLVDGLHPSDIGQKLIGRRATPIVDRLLSGD